MKTIVLDDDPTGTQCATGVRVLLRWDVASLVEALTRADSVYLLTNSRALNRQDAVALAQSIKSDGDEAGLALGKKIQYVLRGDSTLRGHVFTESEVFLNSTNSIIFLPAYPEIGRRTIDGVHYVRIEGVDKPAHETEFAQDPVFSFSAKTLLDFVAEKSDRTGIHFLLAEVREGAIALSQKFAVVAAGSVLLPDAETDADIETIADAIKILRNSGTHLVVRSSAPLAALLAGVRSSGFLTPPLMAGKFSTLLIAGSHTDGATRQLAQISARWGEAEVINTALAMQNPAQAATSAITEGKLKLQGDFLAIITSERHRLSEHNTLAHGEKVMDSLIYAVKELCTDADIVVTKGGITSAEVARSGIGADDAWVLGQILPGISVWKVKDRGNRELLLVIVPGSVGDSDTLMKALEIVGLN